MKSIPIGSFTLEDGSAPVYVCGPCVIENKSVIFKTAEHIKELAESFNVPIVFKSSYLKANRTSSKSYAGPGLKEGVALLAEVKKEFNLPILTDVHSEDEISIMAEIADIIQIPAFLCRQTGLVKKAAQTGKVLNIKKGQFLAPEDMGEVVKKIEEEGNTTIFLTERGTTFGYHNLVVDMRSLEIMKEFGYPVIYDATHSVQLPGGQGSRSGGQREFIFPLARAAAAAGCNGFFIETHPEPAKALSDAQTQLPLDKLKDLIHQTLTIYESSKKFTG